MTLRELLDLAANPGSNENSGWVDFWVHKDHLDKDLHYFTDKGSTRVDL